MNDEIEDQEDEPLTIEQSLRIELAWRTLELEELTQERDKAWVEIQQLKQVLCDALIENKNQTIQIKQVRSEPSRLEIATLILANNTSYDGPERALQRADDLIEAAKKGAK
jgi:hypothetical protein